MKHLLDSRQLRAFAVVAETGSFTLAAQRLHLTQSAVSHAVKALEAGVGCRLLDRVGKKVLLRQAGEALLARTEKIFQEMNAAREELNRLRHWGRGRLRVGASSTACEYILPAVVREFKRHFPHCTIVIEPGDTAEAIEQLRARRVDLALMLKPAREPRLECRPLFTDELMFVVSSEHPWAHRRRAGREEIEQQSYVLYNRKSQTFELIRQYFERERLELSSFIELGSMEAIKELVKLGLGVSILAPWIAREELKQGTLVTVPLGRRKLRRHWVIAHERGRRLSLTEDTFIGLCRSLTRKIGHAAAR